MNADEFFRWIAIAILVVFFPGLAYYRARSNTPEKLDRRQEGALILYGLRLSGLPVFVGTLAWMYDPNYLAWASIPLPMAIRWLGVATLVCWGLLHTWTFIHLGANLTDTVVTRQHHTLVRSGPYGYVRHPFYIAFALALLGLALLAANAFFAVAGISPLGFTYIRTPIEEKKLIERFGDEYRQYMAQTGRFFPRWW